MKRVFVLLLVAAGFLLNLSGCGGDDRDEGEWLVGTQWRLASGVETPPDVALTIGFGPKRTGGQTGCNVLSFDYEADGDSITIGREVVEGTDASCAGTPAETTEATYLSLLREVDGWRIDDRELVLSSDSRDLLRYVPRGLRTHDLVNRLSSVSE